MPGPINRLQPSAPVTANTLERYQGHLIKVDSEGKVYWTRPDDVSRTFATVEACRLDIAAYVMVHPGLFYDADAPSDTDSEAA